MQSAVSPPLTITEVPIGLRDAMKPERFREGLLGQVQPC